MLLKFSDEKVKQTIYEQNGGNYKLFILKLGL